MRHRRKKKGIVKWLPVVIAGVLIIVAFLIAPSLQPPPPHDATGPRAPNGAGGSQADARAEGRMLTSTGGTEGASTAKQMAQPQGNAPETAPPARDASRAGERPNQSTAATTRAKKHRGPAPARPAPEPREGESGDLSVQWNR